MEIRNVNTENLLFFSFLLFNLPIWNPVSSEIIFNISPRVLGTYRQPRGRPSLISFAPLSSDFFLCFSNLFPLLGLHRLLFPFYPKALVTQSYLTPCNLMVSPWNFPGKNTGVPAISFSNVSSQPEDWTWVFRLFTVCATREALTHSQSMCLDSIQSYMKAVHIFLKSFPGNSSLSIDRASGGALTYKKCRVLINSVYTNSDSI